MACSRIEPSGTGVNLLLRTKEAWREGFSSPLAPSPQGRGLG